MGAVFKTLGAVICDIPIDTDLQLKSLGVGCAPSGVSGEVKAGKYMPCGAEDFKLQLLSDTKDFSFLNTAGSEVGYVRSNGRLYFSRLLPNGDTDLSFQLPSAPRSFLFLDLNDVEVASIDSAGKGTFDGGVELGDDDSAITNLPVEGIGIHVNDNGTSKVDIYFNAPSGEISVIHADRLEAMDYVQCDDLLTDNIVNEGNSGPPSATYGILTPSSASITSADSPYTLTTAISTLYIDASGGAIEVLIPPTDGYRPLLVASVAPAGNEIKMKMVTGNIAGAADNTTALTDLGDSAFVHGDGTNGWVA